MRNDLSGCHRCARTASRPGSHKPPITLQPFQILRTKSSQLPQLKSNYRACSAAHQKIFAEHPADLTTENSSKTTAQPTTDQDLS
jgi:hypothetical protein